MGGRVGERAEQPKVSAMRSIVGMAAEGGTDLAKRKTRLRTFPDRGPRVPGPDFHFERLAAL